MTSVFKRDTERREKEYANKETKIRVLGSKQSNVRSHQKLEKIRKDSSLESSKGACFPLISDFSRRPELPWQVYSASLCTTKGHNLP